MKLVIDLPPRDEQIAFNRRRWEELCADRELAKWPGRVETNAHGQILLGPLGSGRHSHLQSKIMGELNDRLGGLPLPACPVSTIDGVRAADVGWYSEQRFAKVEGQIAFETAPEICVEVLSPSNNASEMREKRKLYFEAGANECWLCDADGTMRFYPDPTNPDHLATKSIVCPDFPMIV